MPFSSRVGMMELTGSGPSRLAVDPGSARPMALIRTVLRRSFTSTSGMPDGLTPCIGAGVAGQASRETGLVSPPPRPAGKVSHRPAALDPDRMSTLR